MNRDPGFPGSTAPPRGFGGVYRRPRGPESCFAPGLGPGVQARAHAQAHARARRTQSHMHARTQQLAPLLRQLAPLLRLLAPPSTAAGPSYGSWRPS
eukprot:15485838-Alexandrium_andersonii.AAC.1